jgi:hypothetical protein
MWHPDIPAEYRNAIVTGDARELAKRIPDESVDLIFTDPPYIGDVLPLYEWLGREAYRILKPDSALLCFFGTGFLDSVLPALKGGGLTYRWLLDVKWAGLPLFNGKIAMAGQRCLWLEKGKSNPVSMVKDTWVVSQVSSGNVKYYNESETSGGQRINGQQNWGKDFETVAKWTAAFIDETQVTLDPFTGLGTMPAGARLTGRNYIAFEQDPAIAERARERVANTQSPLFVAMPQQMEMEPLP